MLSEIKTRIGIFYSSPEKDAEIESMQRGAVAFMEGAGFPASLIEDNDPLAIEAVVIYCKMAMEDNADALRINPIWLSILAQARAKGAE